MTKPGEYLSVFTFLSVAIFLVGTTIFYAPSWGLVDDSWLLENAKSVWSGGNFFGNLWQIILDGTKWGMFRPVFFTWNALVYHIFRSTPLLIYLGMAIFNLTTLLLWGFILNKIWLNEEKNMIRDIFLYPLTFFIFTPFWNTFMYISMQQKFIIFFSALAVYFFYKGYTREKKIYFVLSVFAILLGTLTHAEGIFLNLAMLLLSLVLLFLTKKNNFIFSFVLNFILFLSYLFFTVAVQLKGSYTSKYGNSLNNLVVNFLVAPALIKILFFLAIFYFCFLCILIIRKRNKFSPVFLVLPLGFICFIAVLVPWGFPNYHLSALSPFIMGMFFPLYSFLNSRSSILKKITNSALLVIVFLALFFIWIPRISKISDIKKTEEFIIEFEKKQNTSTYFMTSPCAEACNGIGYFTKAKTIYLSDSSLSSNSLTGSANNFVIFRDECPRVYFDGVQESKEIFKNNTWKIFQVNEKKGINKEFNVYFPENPVEKIKNLLKK